ncbi:MAG: COX15/CtaA family protein [Pseudomonadota bacterium]
MRQRPVAIWLFLMCALVALMVMVGGATRLTDSGLSITEWRPVTGAIPPLSEAMWLDEFEKYKTIPEYEQVNWGMSLDEFKVIYWWEWGHRFLGRLIGIAFFVPFVAFLSMGLLTRHLALKLFGLFLLGGAQGALGWWMVSSGLSERIDVSQYRLAAHLGMAMLLFGAMFWVGLGLISTQRKNSIQSPLLALLPVFVFGQIVLGAFVAGLRAGLTYNTWPLMDGRFVPRGYFRENARFNDLFETIEAVQFNHRIGAYLVVSLAVTVAWQHRASLLRTPALAIGAVASSQMLLGIVTLLAGTPIWMGLAHQFGALILFAATIYGAHGLGRSISISNPVSASGMTSRALTVEPSG